MKKILIFAVLVLFVLLIPASAMSNHKEYQQETVEFKNNTSLNNNLKLSFETIAEGLNSPVVLTAPDDGSKRIFVADQIGKIYVINDEEIQSTPFLDISNKLVNLDTTYDERGLLGFDFHPNYENNGRFFVYYSSPKTGEGINHESILSEYQVSSENSNIANPNSEKIIFRIDQPEANHNGGQIGFGPDGYLYLSLGDGGGAGDQHGEIGNGQNKETLLGTIIRIDIDSEDPYSVPLDNPFVSQEGKDEIFAYGFRNPWKFSFDFLTNRFFVADVGQDEWEEINIVDNGGNYGWRIMEGTHIYDGNLADELGIDINSLDSPIHEYSHSLGKTVIGGYVYRGNESSVVYGKYIFGDWSTSFTEANGKIYFLSEDEPNQWNRYEFELVEPFNRFILAFGEDEDGEIYVLSKTSLGPSGITGDVKRLVLDQNQPPNKPIIQGPIEGKPNVEYEFTFSAEDPENEEIYLWVVWGDGCPPVEWLGPYESGEEIVLTHSYAEEGSFTIRAKAKDIENREGLWSDYQVSMPKSKNPFMDFLQHNSPFPLFLKKFFFANVESFFKEVRLLNC